MNRITQCIHGRGTISEMLEDKKRSGHPHQKFLAYADSYRPLIFWNLTERCNLSCTHCYNQSGPEKGTDNELKTAEALAFIDDCGKMGVRVILFSGGEPLIRKDLFVLAEHAASYGISTALSTNGTCISRDIADQIRLSGIGYAGISLDGVRSETHDAFRNMSGAFNLAVKGFEACRAAGVRTGVRVTLTKMNIGELDSLIDLALRLSASRFCVYWLVPSGRGVDAYQQIQLTSLEAKTALNILCERAGKIDPKVMEFLTVDAPQDAVFLLNLMEKEQSKDLADAKELIRSLKGGCSAGTRVANLSPGGDIYPCQFAQIPEFLVGSIRNRLFSEIWNDPGNPVLQLFRNKEKQLKYKCKTCQHLDICGGGCRVRAYHEKGDLSADDPFCSHD